ncbi:LacI family transcriptional regulator [Motilibacter rhizosphaerae]|uniref:LacI family transcriptional regulator n=1 Tax=Motilibacter rhizosphaerae TaxID=598652 RepID=A0A4Q7NV97_9ACTN|nr:LacI family DNA-binding transcriptional regulator [Motilibacter rhizosphaerae]RZS91161.1 LacI family transcriptional regulator [Motilibacter rhizosphaerae]
MPSRVTIADVAARAGVSKGAVSYALNGKPGLTDATRQRILSAADDLGWRPSSRARALSDGRALALGLVVARPPQLLGADPFFPAFIAGVETSLAEVGQSLVLQVVLDEEREEAGYRRLARDRTVDGVFLLDLRVHDARIPLLRELGMPAVTLNRPTSPSPFPAVCVSQTRGIEEVVDLLVGLGHRRIAHVSGPRDLAHAEARRGALSDALARHGLEPAAVLEGDFSAPSGAEQTRRLLAAGTRVTAVVYANDLMAVAGMATLSDAGLRVPEDVSVTGFDDTLLAAYARPGLTTVATDALTWGRQAALTLLQLVEHGHADDVVLEPTRLVRRTSVAPAP